MDHAWVVGELASLASVVGALVGLLPTIATVFAILWYGVMIYDRFWGNPPVTFGEYHDSGHTGRDRDHTDEPIDLPGSDRNAHR